MTQIVSTNNGLATQNHLIDALAKLSPMEMITLIMQVQANNQIANDAKFQEHDGKLLGVSEDLSRVNNEIITTKEQINEIVEKQNINLKKFGVTHVTATQLGKLFKVEISAIKVNKLLKIIKVLRNEATYEDGCYKANNVPYAQYFDNELVIKKIFTDDFGNDHESYYFHKEKIEKLFSKRLGEQYHQLLLLQTKKEIDSMIDDMFSEFING